MHLIVKVIRISCAKFHFNRLRNVQDIQDYASLIVWHTVYVSIFVCFFIHVYISEM